ncbi:MAG: hypothetical protein HW403_646 [Dehalococcoidia bacterium]|nr:hypothetical protein [Dehalococcoidia bacterium]
MRGDNKSKSKKPSKRTLAEAAVTDKALCSDVCRARCCTWSFIDVTSEEAEVLRRRAVELHLPEPPIEAYKHHQTGETAYVMHAIPCIFLSKDNLCSVYRDRPQHCQDFPDTWREFCPLSKRHFPPEPSGSWSLLQ